MIAGNLRQSFDSVLTSHARTDSLVSHTRIKSIIRGLRYFRINDWMTFVFLEITKLADPLWPLMKSDGRRTMLLCKMPRLGIISRPVIDGSLSAG